MAETKAHIRAKKAAAGKNGQIEVPLPNGQRLDALRGDTAFEIERHAHPDRLKLAINRLKLSKAKNIVLQVPQKNFEKAITAMKKAKVTGTVRNMSGSQKIKISAKPTLKKRK